MERCIWRVMQIHMKMVLVFRTVLNIEYREKSNMIFVKYDTSQNIMYTSSISLIYLVLSTKQTVVSVFFTVHSSLTARPLIISSIIFALALNCSKDFFF